MNETEKNINAKCPLCGADIELNTTELKICCPNCGEEISVKMATKYYESLHENASESKEAHGDDYHKLSFVLDELYGFIDIEDYESAEDKFMEALDLTDTDYRVYMAMVAIKTKNYTDLKDEDHKYFINRAIACADADAKKEIVNIYRPYYNKINMSEEDLQYYSEEENRVKKSRLEKGLKAMIPEYMAKEKHNKIYLILFPILIAVGFAVVIASLLIEDIKWFSIVGAAVTVVGYLLFRSWFLNKDKLRTFNSLLDFYDYVDSRSDLGDEVVGKLYFHMQRLCDKFLDNTPIVTMTDDTSRLIDFLISLNDESMNDYLLKDKYFSQFVSEEE